MVTWFYKRSIKKKHYFLKNIFNSKKRIPINLHAIFQILPVFVTMR